MILLQIELDFYRITMIGTALGFILGLIPLVLGLIKKERKYAMFGFLGSLIGGALLGIFLSIPVTAIFTWLILRKPQSENLSTAETSTKICPQCHTQYGNDVTFCLQDGTVLQDSNFVSSISDEVEEETIVLPANAVAPTQASFDKSEKS